VAPRDLLELPHESWVEMRGGLPYHRFLAGSAIGCFLGYVMPRLVQDHEHPTSDMPARKSRSLFRRRVVRQNAVFVPVGVVENYEFEWFRHCVLPALLAP
jgi:hypothetical protein